jgi:hypothetical protein
VVLYSESIMPQSWITSWLSFSLKLLLIVMLGVLPVKSDQ